MGPFEFTNPAAAFKPNFAGYIPSWRGRSTPLECSKLVHSGYRWIPIYRVLEFAELEPVLLQWLISHMNRYQKYRGKRRGRLMKTCDSIATSTLPKKDRILRPIAGEWMPSAMADRIPRVHYNQWSIPSSSPTQGDSRGFNSEETRDSEITRLRTLGVNLSEENCREQKKNIVA